MPSENENNILNFQNLQITKDLLALLDNKKVQQQPTPSSRYKTELCRPFEEHSLCKYGDKCQFAHGLKELRSLSRHPKYKTELCRTFHTMGLCPYGHRCHFVHEECGVDFGAVMDIMGGFGVVNNVQLLHLLQQQQQQLLQQQQPSSLSSGSSSPSSHSSSFLPQSTPPQSTPPQRLPVFWNF